MLLFSSAPRRRSASICHLLAFVCLFALPLSATLRAATAPKTTFDLPADLLEKTVKRFAAQSGLEVLIPSDALAEVRTKQVQGEMTSRQALDAMLLGTGLTVLQDPETGAFTVRKETASPNDQRAATKTPARPSDQNPDAQPAKAAHTARSHSDRNFETGDDIVQVSPFEVKAEADSGYFGANTMSGTRLNSKLEDLASSITVVNKQQMLDLGALDINDIFAYEAGTEGSGQFTDFFVTSNGSVQDGTNSITNVNGGNRIRGLGAANIAINGFALIDGHNNVPADSYNVDAVEISRGPNSNIFGLGDASGTVNLVASSAKLGRSASSLTLRGDSYGGFRSTVDLNRPIGKKVAFRILGLYEEKGFQQQPSADITQRKQGMITFQPFKSTKLRASYESYHNFSRRPNPVTPVDAISEWVAAGRPTWDPVNFTAHRDGQSLGAFRFSQAAQMPTGLGNSLTDAPSRYVDNGNVALWTVGRLTTGANPDTRNSDSRYVETATEVMKYGTARYPLFRTPGISDPALLDWASVNVTSPNYSQSKTDTYNVDLEHIFFNTPAHLLGLQAGWLREDADRYSHLYFGGGQAGMSTIVMPDVNETLLDGSPNPFFMRPYLRGGGPISRGFSTVNDTLRGQLAYQADLTQQKIFLSWLGRQRVSGYGEFRDQLRLQRDYRELVLDNHVWVNAANRGTGTATGGNGTVYRYYVGDKQGTNIDQSPGALYNLTGSQSLYWRNGTTGQWVTEPAQWGESPFGAASTRKQVRTEGLTLQSFFLNERIVTTFGWRYDRSRNQSGGGTVLNAATGVRSFAGFDLWPNPWVEGAGRTKTLGGVVRPLRGIPAIERRTGSGGLAGLAFEAIDTLALHYNTSDSFVPADAQVNILNEQLPNPYGKGKDYGFSFSLFSGKLRFKLNKYETKTIGARNNDSRILANAFKVLDFGDSSAFVDLEKWAGNVVAQRYRTQGITPTADQTIADVAKLMGTLPEESTASGLRGETDDALSRGLELELNYNPTRFWTLKMNATQQKAINSNLSPAIQKWIALRMPSWLAAKDDQGVAWWDTPGVKTYFEQQDAALRVQIAQQGKPRTQIREWRFNAVTSYNFAGVAGERAWLKNLTLGGAVRWEDKGSIGFLGTPEADGVIRSLDQTKPVYDPAHVYFDSFARYNLRLFNGKVRANVQLNARNITEKGGGLRPVAVNPDGRPYLYRIVDPRQFILTTTFDL